MNASQIKVGSFVKINLENSPVMKVERIVKHKALCFWFDKNHALNNKVFSLTELMEVNENVIPKKTKK